MSRPVYVLGTGLSHDGSACLLEDGRIAVAIEKERLTRVKHDGWNDSLAVQYCLDAAGIGLADLALVVQNANFSSLARGSGWFRGPRPFGEGCPVPVITISHHLAHAWSAVGTCPFEETAVLVVDGCGNAMDDCTDLEGATLPESVPGEIRHLYFEKDSYYLWRDGKLAPVYKDFSPWGMRLKGYPMLPPTTLHSIGGLYQAASQYCFRNVDDVGKLMGLAPYGGPGAHAEPIFDLRDGRVFVRYEWCERFDRPARSFAALKRDFRYYADIAWWVQREVERALLYLVDARLDTAPAANLAYAGGVALNAVANARILVESRFDDLYIVPAAADNGLAIGCAYYGWLEVLGRERVPHDGASAFGIEYPTPSVHAALGRDRARPGAARRLGAAMRALPAGLRPERAHDACASLHFRIEDLGEDAAFSVDVAGGRCAVAAGGDADEAGCSVVCDVFEALQLFGLEPEDAPPPREKPIRVSDYGVLRRFHDELMDWARVAREADAIEPTLPPAPDAGADLAVEDDPDFVETAADLLAAGGVVGWFQGGSEFGPRALGRRSILASPLRADVRDWINAAVKRREDFRPFAPSVPREDAAEYFDLAVESPYMILVAPVREEWRERIRSVVHEDGSCRIQTVTPDWNRVFHALLRAFGARTGVPVLLNTSFNRRGMPIVESPDDAIRFYRESPLDALVLGRTVVRRKPPA